jgi:hypothetical protein
MFLCVAKWLTLVLNLPLLAHHIWRYMNRAVMDGPGLYDPITIMNANILAHCPERMAQISFLPLSSFLLPIWHDLCFDELLEQHTEELVQLNACKKPSS